MRQRLLQLALQFVDSAQIEIGETIALVALGLEGHAQPGDGVLGLAHLHVVGADIVVGIAELGIQVDGPVAIGDGALVILSVGLGPAPEGEGFGGRASGNGPVVELDGLLDFPTHVVLVGLAHQLHGFLSFLFVAHGVLARFQE